MLAGAGKEWNFAAGGEPDLCTVIDNYWTEGQGEEGGGTKNWTY